MGTLVVRGAPAGAPGSAKSVEPRGGYARRDASSNHGAAGRVRARDLVWDGSAITDFVCGEPRLLPDQSAALAAVVDTLQGP
jgi:hypothetical protein